MEFTAETTGSRPAPGTGPVGPEAHWPAEHPRPLDPRPIGQVLADRAGQISGATAVQWLGPAGTLHSLTYRELFEEARQLAARLVGVAEPGQRVAVAAGTTVEWLILEYASALAGTVLVPVNPASTGREVDHMLTSARCTALFADLEFRGEPLLARLQDEAPHQVQTFIDLGQWRSLPAAGAELPSVLPTDPFLVQFTSGTTGRPKGAVLSHQAAFNCAALSMVRLGGRSTDRWLNVMPMHHVGGSVSVALAVLAIGAGVMLVPAFEPGLVLDLIARCGSTILGAVPTMQLDLLGHPDFPSTDLSTLRLVQSGGSVVAPSLIRRVEESFGVTVCNAYGQSESPNAIMTSPDDDYLTKAETIGTPLPHREVRIIGPDGRTALTGEVGELVMRSPLVMDGYIGSSDTDERSAFGPDGWLHTGDLCAMDDQGVIRIHGRLRDVIIRGGENIYAAEVEEVLLSHPGIADVAVIGLPDDRWGEVPVAVVQLLPGRVVDDHELEQFGRTRLASFKVPRRWARVDTFPLTASGKVKKFELRTWLA